MELQAVTKYLPVIRDSRRWTNCQRWAQLTGGKSEIWEEEEEEKEEELLCVFGAEQSDEAKAVFI